MAASSAVVLVLIGFCLVVDSFPQGGNNGIGKRPRTTLRPSSGSTSGPTTLPPADPANPIVFYVACPCSYTRQYNPVCGTDGQTYGNADVLRCTVKCGKNVRLYLAGACP